MYCFSNWWRWFSGGDTRGGAGCGGGGGAGGYVNAPFTITNGTYPVTVGAGGPARPSPSNDVTPYPFTTYSGTPSVVNTIVTAYGGGQGGGHGLKGGDLVHLLVADKMDKDQEQQIEKQEFTNPITPTPQGNAGGSTSSGSGRGGAGGGGAGGTGNSGDGTRGGSGGDGVTVAPSFPVPFNISCCSWLYWISMWRWTPW